MLGAAPAPLRPCIEGSCYGESGVDVELRSGIELRFGDASRAAEKWRSAVAVLADPSITAARLCRPAFAEPSGGRTAKATPLPSAEEGSGAACGE